MTARELMEQVSSLLFEASDYGVNTNHVEVFVNDKRIVEVRYKNGEILIATEDTL